MKQTIRRGTTQASMPDGEDHYVIEMWDGHQWKVLNKGPYATKRIADEVGFRLFTDHRK
jgi:hypothetical protein